MPTPIITFDRDAYRTLQKECEAALRPIAEKYGLTLDHQNKCFRAHALPVAFQFLVTKKDKEGNAMSACAQDFVKCASRVGLRSTDLHRELSLRGECFRLVGFNRKARKAPLLVERVRDGRRFRVDVTTVRLALEAQP